MLSTVANTLWGKKARFSYLLIVACILLFAFLGAREIWTQEHRWADIVAGMFYRHDFLHPYLGENTYYDKPLLSYWLIAIIAKVTGGLTTWALRLPSALAGLLAIWSIYKLGATLKNRELGLLSGWILLTTFYFLFWARTSSADMLNLGGTLLAIAWYMLKRDHATFFDYMIFFIIVALTSLCKGLGGAIVPAIAVLTDIALKKSWQQHLQWPLFLAAIPALVIYILPFWASSHFGGEAYSENGLYLVYRENILRYFQPFDHEGPIYTYFIYLPIYLLPWTLFLIPALITIASRWQRLSLNSKWIAWSFLLVFLFFTLSGSRRSYYVLPIVPFAILFMADWIVSLGESSLRQRCAAAFAVCSAIILLIGVDVLPAWYYSHYGVNRFATVLKAEASKTKPWQQWQVIMLDGESKLNFYLELSPLATHYGIKGSRSEQTEATLKTMWPVLQHPPANTIFISRKAYLPILQKYFPHYQLVQSPEYTRIPFLRNQELDQPIAFIPELAH